jgi:hypothetical protein
MNHLLPIFSKVKEMESKGTRVGVVDFLEKLEAYVPLDIH